MTDISRGDASEVGWFQGHTPQAARRGASSSTASVATVATTRRSRGVRRTNARRHRHASNGGSRERISSFATFGVAVLLGGLVFFLWLVFNLWALQWAIGVDLPAAVYHVFAGILIANITGYELLRNLVYYRKKVARMVWCGLGWVLGTARAAGVIAACVVLRIVKSTVVYAIIFVTIVISETWKRVRRATCAVLQPIGSAVLCTVGFLKAMVSNARTAVMRAIHVVLGTAEEAVGEIAINFLRKLGSSIAKGAKVMVYAMLRAMGAVVGLPAGLVREVTSNTRAGVGRSAYTVPRTAASVAVFSARLLQALIACMRMGVRRTACTILRTTGGVAVYAARLVQAMVSGMRMGVRCTPCSVLRTTRRVVLYAAGVLEARISSTWIRAKNVICVVLRAPRGVVVDIVNFYLRASRIVVLHAAGSLEAMVSSTRIGVKRIICVVLRALRGVVVYTINFVKAHLYQTRATRRRRAIDEPLDPTEAADVLPPRRRPNIRAIKEIVHRQPQRVTLRSHGGPACTDSQQTRSTRRYQTEGESEDTAAHVQRHQHRAPTPARPSMRTEGDPVYDAPVQATSRPWYDTRGRREGTFHDGGKKQHHRAPTFAHLSIRAEGGSEFTAPPPPYAQPRYDTRGEGEGAVHDSGKEKPLCISTHMRLSVKKEEKCDTHLPGCARVKRPSVATGIDQTSSRRAPSPTVKLEPAEQTASPQGNIELVAEMARSALRRRFVSHVPTETEAQQSRRHQEECEPNHRAFLTPKQEPGTRGRGDAPAVEEQRASGDQRMKREHSTNDNPPSSNAVLHGGSASPRGSSARTRPTKNARRKHKRRRSTAASEEKSARRRRLDYAKEVHCCDVEVAEMSEMWVWAPRFDAGGIEAVPTRFLYLPVTLIRKSKRAAAARGKVWYVQPGGQDLRNQWDDSGRVIWKVPEEDLFHKAPAASGKGCGACGKTEGQVSWTPDNHEHVCDSCADAPRRELQGNYDARDLGFERARACRCRGRSW